MDLDAASLADKEASLRAAYLAFNARDSAAALDHMTDDVDWPNAWEGGRETGKAAVATYWSRQWQQISPHVEPVAFTELPGGQVRATVHQQVRGLDGSVLADGIVHHTYAFRGKLIARMDVTAPGE